MEKQPCGEFCTSLFPAYLILSLLYHPHKKGYQRYEHGEKSREDRVKLEAAGAGATRALMVQRLAQEPLLTVVKRHS